MPELTDIRRVTAVVETNMEETVLREFKRLGAKGYTCIYCTGKGRHGQLEDPLGDPSPLVQITVMVRPSVALAIMQYMHTAKFQHHPAVAVMDTVTVYANDTFF
jgi:hypothetical protein